MSGIKQINQALISVSDKTGIVEFAQFLHANHVNILSTGGTATLLKKHGIEVTEISDHTGLQEMMQGRVKTLHPKIHGGILARRGVDDDVMAKHEISAIDLVIVNLYPFQATIEAGASFDQAIENIDIGGPAMLRSAAKNHNDVTVLVDKDDYPLVIDQINDFQGTDYNLRKKLAAKVFAHTAHYDGIVSNYLNTDDSHPWPKNYTMQFGQFSALRYGENPQQKAGIYKSSNAFADSVCHANQHQGKALSYNNICDAQAALDCVKEFNQPACVIVKHANPCGVAQASNITKAYANAYQTDPTSAFGGIIAFNQTLDAQTTSDILNNQFVEVIVAPKITEQALALFNKKPNIRVLETGTWENNQNSTIEFRSIGGDLLVQDQDNVSVSQQDIKVVTQIKPEQHLIDDLLFAWKVVKYVKSNAIVYAKNNCTVGIGAGQMSRVYSAKIAAIKAKDENLSIDNAVMASDAFFPFPDTLHSAHEIGIRAIIQPGGSINDETIIKTADELEMSMVFTGVRHFRH